VTASPTTPPTQTGPIRPPYAGPGDSGSVPQSVIDAAIADAATRVGADPAAVTVVTAEAVTWPDGALGCPEPGHMYTQMVTPGYHVVVDAGGTRLDYRAGRQGTVSLCANPRGPG
jgi:hypothetical protein